jgi:hypothetical protein
MWCQMRGLRMTLCAVTTAATLAGVIVAGSVNAAAAGPAGVARSAPDRAAAPAFSETRPATFNGLADVSCVSASFCVAVGDFLSPTVTTSYPPGIVRPLAEEWNGSNWLVLHGAATVGVLEAVACTSVSFCMAVGDAAAVAGPSLAEVWNGRTWRVVKTPPGGTDLSAVSCATASFCVAVPGNEVSYVAEEWNGRAWRLMNMSGDRCISNGTFDCALYGVSCPSARSCMAVGTYGNVHDGSVQGKALRWNGRTWRDTSPPSTGLAMVSCASTSSCLAIGDNAIAWSGSSWRQVAAPAALWLRDLSCPRPGSCVLVGGQGIGASPASAQAWNGRTWRLLRPVEAGESGRVLFNVSCWRASACMAVGLYSTESSLLGDEFTLAEQWNGTTWRVRRTPSPDDPLSGLSGIACPATSDCMAVGSHVNGSDVRVTLAEQWNGRAWRVRATPSPGNRVSILSAVSCANAARCVAVGYYDSRAGHQTLAEEWNGRTWRRLVTPYPGAGSGILSAVYCLSAVSCMAVGSTGAARRALAEEWDGRTWRVLAPRSPDNLVNELTDVSCTTSVRCIAVGDDTTTPQEFSTLNPLAEAWDGTAWRVLPSPGSVGFGQLASVACTGRLSCTAVGAYLNRNGQAVRPLAEAWSGGRWRVLATPGLHAGDSGQLAAVSCTRASICTAVGGFVSRAGNDFLLAEAWNGARWRSQRITSPDPAFNALYGISCASASRCTAAGETGVQLTLAEQWDGATWRRLPTPNP